VKRRYVIESHNLILKLYITNFQNGQSNGDDKG